MENSDTGALAVTRDYPRILSVDILTIRIVAIVGDNAGGAWHRLERTRNVYLAPRIQRVFVCAWNSAWNRHGIVHGIDTEQRMECAWNEEHGIQENTGILV